MHERKTCQSLNYEIEIKVFCDEGDLVSYAVSRVLASKMWGERQAAVTAQVRQPRPNINNNLQARHDGARFSSLRL